MPLETNKRQLKEELELAKQNYMRSGRRVARLTPEQIDHTLNAKPRKQRLKMFA
jgi:hypothetical protein